MDSGKFYKTQVFKELQREWHEKLQDSGFNDIEYSYGTGLPDHFVKPALGTTGWPVDNKRAEHTLEYFNYATKFLWDYSFKKPKHKVIWRLHAQGLSLREIARHVQKAQDSHGSVAMVIKRIRPIFFEYMRQQIEWEHEQENEED